jgi:hypothetical protein
VKQNAIRAFMSDSPHLLRPGRRALHGTVGVIEFLTGHTQRLHELAAGRESRTLFALGAFECHLLSQQDRHHE